MFWKICSVNCFYFFSQKLIQVLFKAYFLPVPKNSWQEKHSTEKTQDKLKRKTQGIGVISFSIFQPNNSRFFLLSGTLFNRFIISFGNSHSLLPTLKVSVTKVRGFFDLREWNFQSSFHIRCNEMMKIRGDRNAKSLKLYYTNFKSFSNKSSRIFWFERMVFSNLFSHKGQQHDENKRWAKREILETLLNQL